MSGEPPLLPGAEPFFLAGGEVGVLLSHGFTGTPQSMRPLGQLLAERGGLTVSGPLLPGHGTTPEAMARSTEAEWRGVLDDALADLQRRCRVVFVAGLSMGGTLALNLAARQGPRVGGVVTINGAILGAPDPDSPLDAPSAPAFLPGIGSDIKDPGVREVAYDRVPVASLRQLHLLLADTRARLPGISIPALILQSRDDHVVQPASAEYIYEHIGSGDRRLIWLENSHHVATLDYDQEQIAVEMLRFIQQRLG